jgi:hypothetical protein
MTYLDELAGELVILFAADPVTYAEYLKSILTMETEAIEVEAQITLTTRAFRRALEQAAGQARAFYEGE